MTIGRFYWLKRARAATRRYKPFEGWEKSTEIGIVLPAGTVELGNAVRNAAARWRDQGKHVRLLHYDIGRLSRKAVRQKDTFYRNELSWKGIPSSPEVAEWLSHDYDVVLHLCPNNRGPIAFLPTMETAAVRVGPASWNDPSLDMEVKMNLKEPESALQAIENWLKNIRYVA